MNTARRPLAERALSARVKAVPPSGIRRFFDIAATMHDVISLGVGEPDFATPPQVIEAGIASLRAERTHYTSNFGTIELRRAIAAHLEHRYGVAYDPASEILVTVGASEAVDLALRATIDPGDEVILHEPSFVAYVPAVVFAGGTVRTIATRFEDDFALDPAAVEAAVTPATKAPLPRLSLQPDRRDPAARRPGRAGGDRRPARPARLLGRDLRPPGVRRLPPPGDERAAGHARADDPDGRVLEGLRHDRLADRLRLRPRGDPRGDREGPPVRDHVGPHHRPGRGTRRAHEWRGRRGSDARRVRPAPAPDRRRPQRPGPRNVRAAGRLLRLPPDHLDRPRRQRVRRAPAPGGARGGRAGERLRPVRRRARPHVLRDQLREDRGGPGADRPVRRTHARRAPRDRVGRPRALRGGHRRRGPLPGPDREQDVLRLRRAAGRRGPEHAHLPGLPGAARRPAHDQPGGRRARAGHRPGARGDGPGRHPLGPQELLLPRPPEGLPDQPVRPAAGVERVADRRHVGGAGDDRDHPGTPRGGHGEARPRHGSRRATREPGRLQPGRRRR